ncbi:hypothetical protein AB0L64_09095 [Kribbella sp. NPDC051936]|uniref:hypothetical protein n=1 Tax=Kribbella sp. NPDC051936 TaxID=3154946 RepID=UPI00341A6BD9
MDTAEASGPEPGSAAHRGPVFALDVVIGASTLVVARTVAAGRGARHAVATALQAPRAVPGQVAGHVPGRERVDSWVAELARRGEREQDELKDRVTSLADDLVRAVLHLVLDRIDLTETVRQYVDVNSIVRDVDLEAVIGRMDVAGLAEGVIAEVDIAEIIRQSTGSLTSETVQSVRMQGISGDEAIDKATGRIRVRFSRKHAPTAARPEP